MIAPTPLPRPTVLIVDDEPAIREYLCDALGDSCEHLREADSVQQAVSCMENVGADIVLCDMYLPGQSGLEVLELALRMDWDSAFILMTGKPRMEELIAGVRLRAYDFLLKPFSYDALIASVERTYQRLLDRRQRRMESALLNHRLRRRTHELQAAMRSLDNSYRSALETLIATLDFREHETCAHSFRVRAYVVELAHQLQYPELSLPQLAQAALLHDIGKIAISDSVLMKPGRLSPEEFRMLQQHSVIGEKIVTRMGFLNGGARVIRNHHEHFDGTGYPDKLRGTDIPYGSRIFAIVDAFDAMTSDRCYRPAMTYEAAIAEILRCAGTQFDPDMVEAFVRVTEQDWIQHRQNADRQAKEVLAT